MFGITFLGIADYLEKHSSANKFSRAYSYLITVPLFCTLKFGTGMLLMSLALGFATGIDLISVDSATNKRDEIASGAYYFPEMCHR